MNGHSRQTRSAGTASIHSDKQEVLAQSLQQDVMLLDCDPSYFDIYYKTMMSIMMNVKPFIDCSERRSTPAGIA